MPHYFEVGKRYQRQSDIHAKFGGSRQSGISPSKDHPFIFLFTGESGDQYGYADHWDGQVFYYTGEGQVGDMTFTKGNKAIRDHVGSGKSLLLFKALGKSKPCEFLGEFVCETYETREMKDRNGAHREGIVFHLIDVTGASGNIASNQEDQQVDEDLSSLRQTAYAASKPANEAKAKEGLRRYYERSTAVKTYVLKRAQGKCECCGARAPFLKTNGLPYLEPHHIRQLSDNGLDRPDYVAALTPNCHREIHHGINGKEKNAALALIIRDKENKGIL